MKCKSQGPRFFFRSRGFLKSIIKFLLKAFKFKISDSDLGLLWKRVLNATISYSVNGLGSFFGILCCFWF